MKNKEIEVWVNEKDFGEQSGTVWFGERVTTRNPNSVFYKATLIIEEPEPEVAITPSKLRDKVMAACDEMDKNGYVYKPVYLQDFIEKELFGSEG